MQEIVESVGPPVPEPRDRCSKRVGKEVDVEETIKETRTDKQRHAQAPDVALGGDSARHGTDGWHDVRYL